MRYIRGLFVRIFIAVSLLTVPVNVFYLLFSNITLYGSLPFLYLAGYSLQVEGYSLIINGQSLEFVSACVATSAYYLLALLVLLTKDVNLKKRVYLFLCGCFLILLMNIVRIDILLYLLMEFGENWFDKVHIFFWQFVSSFYVAGVWIFLAYKSRIKSVPVYSDLKFLWSNSIFKKKIKKRKRSSK